MYIFIGICLFLIVLSFLFAQKFAPNSAMMVSFQGKKLKVLLTWITIAAILTFSYGIYHKVTYQLSYIDIEVNNNNYTVFGNIGELGYYSDSLVKQGKETTIMLVSWKEINHTNTEFHIQYPTGKETVWKPHMSKLHNESIQDVKRAFQIKSIYELPPYTFQEAGRTKITLKNGKENIGKMTIDVKKDK
ncbi:hypothetical protein BAMA_22410 [Bacillus manliponensis]|uniref:Uncharacterized protein n=1 Tax=Bacillus manliponensis TaxID=574376 RepID=A0A073KB76_9BACI|nr:hypothetical protein [Bacillus manliponensis]KEK19548.1 hypothetical protein BAMA_22410 [Bacillus manliponensis]